MSNAQRIQRIRADLSSALTDLHDAESYINRQMDLSDIFVASVFARIDDAKRKVKSASNEASRLR